MNEHHREIDSRKSVMEFAYREWLGAHMVRFMIVIAGAGATAFALAGPVGTYEALTLSERLGFCFLIASTVWPICYSLNLLTLYLMRFRGLLQITLAFFVAALFEAMISTALVNLAGTVLRLSYPTSADLPSVYVIALLPNAFCNLLYLYLVYQRVRSTGEPTNANPASAWTFSGVAAGKRQQSAASPGKRVSSYGRLMDLLPPELGNDLIYLKSEDHYVYVYTTAGSSLIRMRFSDAVAGLREYGTQVHRSYWVAHRHVQELVNRDRKLSLRLTGNHQVPVSGPYRGAVRRMQRGRGER